VLAYVAYALFGVVMVDNKILRNGKSHAGPGRQQVSIPRPSPVEAKKTDALCGMLSEVSIPPLTPPTYLRHYNAGELIVGTGQRQERFAVVRSGVVKLSKSMLEGRQQIVGLLFASDFLGRPFGKTSPCTAEAATDVTLCCMDQQPFDAMMLECPEVLKVLLKRTLERVDAGQEWMLLLGQKTAEERVATLILRVGQRICVPGAMMATQPMILRFELPLSRTEMAEYLGLRAETIARELSRLKLAGVIEADKGRTITVRDIGKLARIAGYAPA
jgi:CRP/FNR family transcriptional regulator, anaerobic regulatory protein